MRTGRLRSNLRAHRVLRHRPDNDGMSTDKRGRVIGFRLVSGRTVEAAIS